MFSTDNRDYGFKVQCSGFGVKAFWFRGSGLQLEIVR